MREGEGAAQVLVFGDDVFAREAAERIVARARAAIDAKGWFGIALSGGSTPRPVYEALAHEPYRDQIDWTRVQVFFSDERFVPPDSPESNYRMAQETLLSRVPIPATFVHRVATVDMSPQEAAGAYEEGIRRVFHAGQPEVPIFDLILLGMGPDGHTASLFPGTEALTNRDRLVVPNFVPKFESWRVTFTYPLLNTSSCVMFLVKGADKAEPAREVLSGERTLPAAAVRPVAGDLIWILDDAAAGEIGAESD